MLENIKSSYFVKNIYTYLYDKKKFKLIKYNKNLQRKIGLDIIDYRKFSGRYIIYEKEEKKGKEYDSFTDELIFEGEYLKGERNGKGKEYDKYGELIFEGEYLNGKMWKSEKSYYYYSYGFTKIREIDLKDGKVIIKEYYCGKLIFEEKYLNGEKNGTGKEYYEDQIIFEGEYLNGCKWSGNGYNSNNNAVYELKNGKGTAKEYNINLDLENTDKEYQKGKGYKNKYIHCENLQFEGEYLYGKKWNGKIYNKNNQIIIELKQGKGLLKEYNDGKLKFEGEFSYGNRNGKGKEYDNANQIIFDGEYLNGKKWNGKGYDNNNVIYKIKNGNGFLKEYKYPFKYLIFESGYLDGRKNGKVKEYNYGTLVFEGEYLNGKRNGKGKEYNYTGKLEFEGEYLIDERWNGKGKEFQYNELIYEGEILHGKKWNGKGKEFNKDGELIFEGEFFNGKRWNGSGKLFEKNIMNIDELIFEGKYNKGKKIGYIKKYFNNGKLKFEGEYLNGKRNRKKRI